MGRQKKRGRARYWEQVRELEEEHGWSTPEAREHWPRFYKKGGKARKSPNPAPSTVADILLATSPTDGTVCPYCRVGFLPDEVIHTCPGCRTMLHEECKQEMRNRCSTLGCAGGRNAAQTVDPLGETPTIRIVPNQLPRRWWGLRRLDPRRASPLVQLWLASLFLALAVAFLISRLLV